MATKTTKMLVVLDEVVLDEGKYYLQKHRMPAGPCHLPDLTDIASGPLMEYIVNDAPSKILKLRNGKHCMESFRDGGCRLVTGVKEDDSEKIKAWFDSIYRNLNFEIKISKKIDFLDISMDIEDGMIITRPDSKISSSHKYLNPYSCHDRTVIEDTPYSIFYREKMISNKHDRKHRKVIVQDRNKKILSSITPRFIDNFLLLQEIKNKLNRI